MQITPLRGKVLVEIIDNEPMSKGGLHIARITKEIPTRGRCIAVGKPPRDKKGKEIDWGIKIGSVCHFKRRFGIKYEPRQGKRQLFLNRDEIVGVSDERLKKQDGEVKA